MAKRLVFLLIPLVGLNTFSESLSTLKPTPFRKQARIQKAEKLGDGQVTLFIHGTIFPIISRFTHGVEYPHGIIALKDCKDTNKLTRIAYTLAKESPSEFPIESFYFFCWPGGLHFDKRKKATELLYHFLSKHQGPITIIAHSHGCNVALYLAECIDKTCTSKDSESNKNNNNHRLSIDRLILLACPVQLATAHLVNSSLFKEVYSFYSTADLLQTLDPQGIYKETKKVSKDRAYMKKIPFFSQRTFEDAPNLIQTRILFDRQSPGHIGFLSSRFLKQLPSMLSILKRSAQNKRFFIMNLSSNVNKIEFIEPLELAHAYVPRRTSKSSSINKKNRQPLVA